MKKLVALAMSLTMASSLVACGNSDASANAGTDTTATSAAATIGNVMSSISRMRLYRY